jgi:hypothetical protein
MSTTLRSSGLLPVLLLSGCSHSGPQAVPIKAVDDYAAKTHADGLSAGAEPFDTYAKSTEVFGAHIGRNFTPVQLAVENTTPDKFLLQRSNAKLICGDGTTLEAVSALTMFEPYREHRDGYAPIGAWSNAETSLVNERTKSDWMEKEFPAETILTAGKRAGGFLYFRGICRYRQGRRLQVMADKVSSPDVVSFSLEL